MNIEAILDERDRRTEERNERAKTSRKVKVRKLTKKEEQILELANRTVMPENYFTVWTVEELEEMAEFLKGQEIIAIDTETMGLNPWKDEIVGISVYAPYKGYYIPLKHVDEDVVCLNKDVVRLIIKPIFEDRSKKFLFHNASFDMHVLRIWMDIHVVPYFDTSIAQALLDENQPRALKEIAPIYLGVEADKYSTLFGKTTFDKIPIKMNPVTRTGNLASYYAIKDTELTYRMFEFQSRAFSRKGLEKIKKLFYEIEMPFLNIVVKAEAKGVKLDVDYLNNKVAVQLRNELEELRKKIWKYTGKINLNSPAQLSTALYSKLKLPVINPDKPNSTDRATLMKLKGKHPVIEMILDFREKSKLTQAFADKLPLAVINGRVHTNFDQVGTVTGRMSSKSPNLQQIPARVGGLIRNAFVADEGRLLASIDFSQQEIRVLAHVSQDKVLLNTYKEGKDVHAMTAVSMWNMSHKDKVTYEDFEYRRKKAKLFLTADGEIDERKLKDEKYIKGLIAEGKLRDYFSHDDPYDMYLKDVQLGLEYEKLRSSAKTVNFGIIYGMSEKTLAERLEITEEEAKAYIDAYFKQYPGVKKWMSEQKKKMLEVKYTETMLGRKRRVYPELSSGKSWLIQKGFRMGINAVIQGSSADMIKKASIDLQGLLEELDAQIVLWVHDEIIFDVPENIGMENLQRIADVMCNALPLDCGMKSDIEVGKRWGQKLSEDDLLELMEEVS